uniref:Carrier domain-containing protein n=1 Tax=Meleagris gallopavo TaxID=9103 RepID=A0A803Y3F1_MELGA
QISLQGSMKEETLQELQERLPTHGIPDELVQIKTLPLTSHGKVDISELNKIYHYHLNSRRRDSKLSGAEELWERLQYLWKSVLDLLDDSSGISKDAVFLYSGGDSLKALQFYDEIEMLVGRGVPGLLEVILSRSIEEVYKHILKTVFPDEDQKYAKLQSEGYLKVAPGLISFIALRRGNHFFSMDFTSSFMQPSSTVQVGGESLQQPSFLNAVTPSITKSHMQGHEKENRTLTITNKENKTDCYSVQQICAECNYVTTAELALRTRWKSNTRKCVDASPLIVISSKDEESASVFVGSHSHAMQAIDLDTGEVKWEKNLGDRIESSACVSKCGNFIVVGKDVHMEIALRRWSCVFISLSEHFSTSCLCCYARRTVTGCQPGMYHCQLVFNLNVKFRLNQNAFLKLKAVYQWKKLLCLYWMCGWKLILLHSLWRKGKNLTEIVVELILRANDSANK